MSNFLPTRVWQCLHAAACAVLLALLGSAHATELTVTKIDGTQLTGELAQWSTTELSLSAGGETTTIASPEVLRVEWQRGEPDDPSNNASNRLLELVDGTRLPHTAYIASDTAATVTTSLSPQPLSIPRSQISVVQFVAEADLEVDWKQLTKRAEAGDVLLLRKKSGATDFLAGVIGEISPEQVQFTWEGEAIPVKRAKVAALAYFHAKKPKPGKPVCWLKLRGGGRLPVAHIALQDGQVRATTTGGLALEFPAETVVAADYSAGKLVYLSDQEPIAQNWTPLIGLPATVESIQQHGLPRRDQSFTGSALTLLWPTKTRKAAEEQLKTYAKGLALRSRTVLRYRVPDGMQRFIALAGIDPETASQGNVTLEIFADRESVWQGPVVGGAAPVEIDVALGDARELRLVVDYGENLDFGDRLHLVEARLSK